MPLNRSELGLNITMFFSKTYCWDFLYTDGLVNLKCMAWGPTICICEMSVWCWPRLGGFMTCSYMDGHL